MSRNRRFLIWAIALALALIMVSGCSNSDDQNNITPVSDQTIKISGQVTDALGEPVSKIAVYLHESKSSADKGKKIDTSDKTGSFSLILPRDGDYSVSVASQGAAAEASFSVKNNAMQSSTGRPLKTLEINLPFYSQKPDALPLNDEGDVKTDKDGLLIIDNILEIVWRKNVSAAEQKRVIANVGGLKIRGDIAELNITEVEVIRGDIDKKATELERSPLIKVAVKDYVIETQYVPSDSDYKNKWKSWWLRKLEAEQVWEIIKRKKPPVGGVVVTDSGFQETHPDLKKIFHTRLRRNYTADPFTDNAAHGNHVSGIISMQANNL
ncbi:MAG: carboxypeptidase regulatory-like domain-containing protein, partial [Actinomycetia bacterium]|nr:carboxypeptidase regulatory-like domain-containing protein [Actinomycetes bacterium]